MNIARLLQTAAARERSKEADLQLGVILAFVAGTVNAGGFIAVGRYTSHMTGIVSSIGDALAIHQTAAALDAFSFLAAFITGATTTSIIVNIARARHWKSEFASALMLEAILLLIFGISAAGVFPGVTLSLNLTIALLCYLMGLQNALIGKISHSVIRTTHVTGIATDIGIEIGRHLFKRCNPALEIPVHIERLYILLKLLFAFLAGSIFGAYAFKFAGFFTTIPLAVMLVILALTPILEDIGLLQRKHS